MISERARSREDEVYMTLEEDILSGVYKNGDSLTEQPLSDRLGVSRTPIRAALRRLSEEGLVELIPNKGAVVIGVTAQDLIDTYKIRMRLEGLASAEAATKISKEDMKRLADSVELSEFYLRKRDLDHLKELDSEFHNIIYKASGNRLLSKTLSELHRSIQRYRRLSLTVPERLEKCIAEHREILAAIERGDAEAADGLTEEHISAALDNLLAVTNNK